MHLFWQKHCSYFYTVLFLSLSVFCHNLLCIFFLISAGIVHVCIIFLYTQKRYVSLRMYLRVCVKYYLQNVYQLYSFPCNVDVDAYVDDGGVHSTLFVCWNISQIECENKQVINEKKKQTNKKRMIMTPTRYKFDIIKRLRKWVT